MRIVYIYVWLLSLYYIFNMRACVLFNWFIWLPIPTLTIHITMELLKKCLFKRIETTVFILYTFFFLVLCVCASCVCVCCVYLFVFMCEFWLLLKSSNCSFCDPLLGMNQPYCHSLRPV